MTHDPLRAALLSARVPRYTSYPPADRFGPEVGIPEKTAWLSAVPPGSGVSLYVHVPYCRRLCWFCACRTQGTRNDAPLDRYLDHLEREIEATRALLSPDVRIEALHLGGGTPTLLSPDRLDRLADMLRGVFPLTEDTEVSAEIDPCEFDAPRADALLRLGLSRASLGVQDFDPIVQDAIGRRQSAEVTAAAMDLLRARGVRGINVDLLYGLPFQTPERLDATLDRVVDLAPERLALYGYAHVPWVARRQKLIPEHALPAPAARLDLAERARDKLTLAGYQAVGIDHFARPGDSLARAAAEGRLHRNFQGYTTDAARTLIGLGPSAISRFEEGYVQNAAASDAWQHLVAEGRLPAARGVRLTAQTRARVWIIERLMCEGRVDLAHPGALDRDAVVARARAALADLPGAGDLHGDVLSLRDPRAARLIARAFDEDTEARADRYSQAS